MLKEKLKIPIPTLNEKQNYVMVITLRFTHCSCNNAGLKL
jgi:hypothetical protein